jgi:hypothetical protein
MSDYGSGYGSTKQMQKECFTCGQQIYLTRPSPGSPWVKTNLDGSEHRDAKKSSGQFSSQRQLGTDNSTSAAAQRSDAIAKAHEENMEASKNLTFAITNLTVSIESLRDLVKIYLETGVTKA